MNEQPSKIEKTERKLRRLLGYLPACVILPILIYTLLKNFNTLSSQQIDFVAWPLIFSFPLLMLHFTLSGLGWWMLIHFLGTCIPIYQAIRITVLSLLGRYIPGKIWTILGKVYMGNKIGLSKRISIAASAYELFFFNVSGLFIFVLVEFLYPIKLLEYRSLYVILLILVSVIITFPNLITASVNIALRLTKKDPVDAHIKPIHALSTFFYYSGSWLITGLSFYFFVRAIFQEISFIILMGALVLANIVGFVFIVTPGGLGIREGTMAYVLSAAEIPVAQAILIALACRVWSTSGELLAVVPLWLYKGKRDCYKGLSNKIEAS